MENTERDAVNTVPQTDWRNDETNSWLTETPNGQNGELLSGASYGTHDFDERLSAMASNDDPNPKEDEDDDNDDAGDWGHVDPAEGNGPFPDPNAPSGPGSAV
jgi:hypothetical protein